MRHLVSFNDSKIQKILKGELGFDLRLFKEKPEFLKQLSVGDKVFLRKASEVLAQFEVGKIVVIENAETRDFEIVKSFINDLNRVEFEKSISKNSLLVITQIQKLEQLITSPIEVPYNLRKEWLVLD